MRWLLFDTAGKRSTSRGLNTASHAVEPRLVDNPKSEHFGKHVLNASILSARGYERFNASMRSLAQFDAEPADLFLPSED